MSFQFSVQNNVERVANPRSCQRPSAVRNNTRDLWYEPHTGIGHRRVLGVLGMLSVQHFYVRVCGNF